METPTYDSDLSQLCASFDEGGGVALGGAFSIYSIVASSPDWSTTTLKSGLDTELTSAASAVGNVIPVLVTRDNVFTADFVSLPCPKHPSFNSASDISPRDSLPWFLINASKFSKHQIIGRGNIIESLLVILQRPWCVLELCCCDILAILAIYRFALIATKMNPKLYSYALVLLRQELRRRTVLSLSDIRNIGSSPSPSQHWISFTELDTTSFGIREIYSNLSFGRLRSHNSFWLRLISVCAPFLGISYASLVHILSDMTSMGVNPSRQKPTNHQYYSCTEHLLLQSLGSVTISTCNSVLPPRRSTLTLKEYGKCPALYDLEVLSSDLESLLLVYRNVLQVVSESLS